MRSAEDRKRNSRPALALCAVAGPVLLTASWIVLGSLSQGYTMWGTRVAHYSALSQPISGLGLGLTGPYMNAAFIVSGLLIIVGIAGVFLGLREMNTRSRWLSAGLLALPGLGSIVDGLFTFEHFFFHLIGFALALSTVAGFPIAGWLLLRVPGWRRIGTGLIA